MPTPVYYSPCMCVRAVHTCDCCCCRCGNRSETKPNPHDSIQSRSRGSSKNRQQGGRRTASGAPGCGTRNDSRHRHRPSGQPRCIHHTHRMAGARFRARWIRILEARSLARSLQLTQKADRQGLALFSCCKVHWAGGGLCAGEGVERWTRKSRLGAFAVINHQQPCERAAICTAAYTQLDIAVRLPRRSLTRLTRRNMAASGGCPPSRPKPQKAPPSC
ncbi:hypothetical protein LI328DRAFT_105932 [Trichoderma asperelloides]|nr:hypothetical protein LI328DRAFT_105932 [Trichoderma asperelloides]